MEEFKITPAPIHDYCVDHSSPLPEIFQALSKQTELSFPKVAHMQIGALEGMFLRLMTQLSRAHRVLEFGTFTGFSALNFALALPDEGKVTTLDRDPKATAIAQKFWAEAKVSQKVELILGDGRESVKLLLKEVQSGQRRRYDLAFIDADKAGYDFYYESCLELVKVGGLIITDNVLWYGAVLAPLEKSDHAICAFNEKLRKDPRVELVLLPIRDGLSVARIL